MTHIKKVLSCFQEAGFHFDIMHFEHRLIAQKFVYLLEESGIRLGYRNTFSFYLRGTYSPKLTKDLFRMKERAHAGTIQELSAADRARISKLMASMDLRPHLLEVMAAYRFLRNQGKTEDQAIRTIKATKPFISERDVAIGISKCKGLFPEITPQDLAQLDQEMTPWESASHEDE